MVVVGTHFILLLIVVLVGNPFFTAKIYFLLPFQRQPSKGPRIASDAPIPDCHIARNLTTKSMVY